MATEQIVIEYIAQVEGLKAQLRTVQTELKNVQKTSEDSAKATTQSFSSAGESIKGIAIGIATSLAATFSVQKVIQFANESIKAFQEAEAVAKKLEFAVTRIGKEGADAFQRLTKEADRLSKITIFDDESIRKSQTQLAQFGLQSQAIQKLLPQIIDLASATGLDLAQATDLAIQGINGQGRALKPYGIILDDTGSKTKNLSILTDGLSKFTGSAGEAFNTAAGQAKFYDNQINELQESIGEKLSPALSALKSAQLATLSGFNSLIDQGNKDREDQIKMYGSGADKLKLAQKESEDAKKKFLEDDANLSENAVKQDIGLTQKGIDAKKALEKKYTDDLIAEEKKRRDDKQELDKLIPMQLQEVNNELSKEDKEYFAKKKKDTDEWIENDIATNKAAEEQKKQDREDVNQASVEFISQSVNALFEYQNQKDEEQLANFRGTEEEKDALTKQIAKKKFKRDKEQALFNIAIATAEAIAKSLPNVALSIIVAAIGAVQAAAVLARPEPFAKGVIDLKGGVQGKDSIPAILMPGESVMTTEETQRHGDLLRSIRSKNLDEFLMDNYINPKLSAILGSSTAENMAKSTKLNGLDEYGIGRAMRRNNGVNVQNAEYLGKVIAREIKRDSAKRTWSA